MIMQRLTKPVYDTMRGIHRRRRGFTFIETTMAIGAFSGVSAFVMSLAVLTSRQADRTISSLPAEMNTFRLMEHSRAKLLSAQSGRIYVDPNNPNEITFFNSAVGQYSVLSWNDGSNDAEKRGLWYKEGNGNLVPVGSSVRIEDMRFDVDDRLRRITITMVHESKDRQGLPSTFTREEQITARN